MDSQEDTVDNSDGVTLLESLDNSNGVQYYGGNDPSKMSGRFKKGGGGGGGQAKAKTPNQVFSRNVAANVTSISPNAPISPRIAARTTTDLGAPRVSSGRGLQR